MIEAVVVGGGISGSAVALALRDRDALVTVVDSGRAGGGATGASAGMLAPQYEVEDPGALFGWSVEAREEWLRFAETITRLSGETVQVARPGMLVANLSREETERSRETARWQGGRGLAADVLTPAEARDLEPAVSEEPHSFLWLPEEKAVDAQRLSILLADALDSAGVRVLTGNPVRELERKAQRVTGVIMGDGRSLTSDRVVVAAGAWSPQIEGLPRSLPVRPVKGQLLRYAPEGTTPRRIVSTHDGAYLVPRSDGSILAGSTMEYEGYDRTISREARRSIRERLAPAVTGLEGRKPTEQWAGLRPVSKDGLPILGPDPDVDGLYYATGYGRNGILLSPLCGRVVAGLAMGVDPNRDWEPFGVGRFG